MDTTIDTTLLFFNTFIQFPSMVKCPCLEDAMAEAIYEEEPKLILLDFASDLTCILTEANCILCDTLKRELKKHLKNSNCVNLLKISYLCDLCIWPMSSRCQHLDEVDESAVACRSWLQHTEQTISALNAEEKKHRHQQQPLEADHMIMLLTSLRDPLHRLKDNITKNPLNTFRLYSLRTFLTRTTTVLEKTLLQIKFYNANNDSSRKLSITKSVTLPLLQNWPQKKAAEKPQDEVMKEIQNDILKKIKHTKTQIVELEKEVAGKIKSEQANIQINTEYTKQNKLKVFSRDQPYQIIPKFTSHMKICTNEPRIPKVSFESGLEQRSESINADFKGDTPVIKPVILEKTSEVKVKTLREIALSKLKTTEGLFNMALQSKTAISAEEKNGDKEMTGSEIPSLENIDSPMFQLTGCKCTNSVNLLKEILKHHNNTKKQEFGSKKKYLGDVTLYKSCVTETIQPTFSITGVEEHHCSKHFHEQELLPQTEIKITQQMEIYGTEPDRDLHQKEIPRPKLSKEILDKFAGPSVFSYHLSNADLIKKKYTKLPELKIKRQLKIYKMVPRLTSNWFTIPDDGYPETDEKHEQNIDFRNLWYYLNGIPALKAYKAQEEETVTRFVVFDSTVSKEGHGNPCVLAIFDHLGNGIVYDKSGNIRLRYNQTEGEVLDSTIGPVERWKWHFLNEPPEIKSVYIERLAMDIPARLQQMMAASREPRTKVTESRSEKDIAEEKMKKIEKDNEMKIMASKPRLIYKPCQIKAKTVNINNQFTLHIIDQTNICLIFQESHTPCFKLHLGMVLDPNDISVTEWGDTDTVWTPFTRKPNKEIM